MLTGKLTATKVRTLTKPGRYGDGGNLWLQVRSPTNKSWLVRIIWQGKPIALGLGPVALVSLAEARDKALEIRKLVLNGIDPRSARAKAPAPATEQTFARALSLYIDSHSAGWRNARAAQDWRNSLDQHVIPQIGAMPVRDIGTEQVLRVLAPLWRDQPVRGARVAGRVARVLAFAAARGWRDPFNPAEWRNLKSLLPAPRQVQPLEHMRAVSWQSLPDLWPAIAADDSPAGRALQLLVLTATRTGEVLQATWSEIDIATRVWTIPKEHTKTLTEQRVPLSAEALTVLGKPQSGLIFPGRQGRPLSPAALRRALRKHNVTETVHGFRSAFRSWIAEATDYPRELGEAALGHSLGSVVETSYLRSDLFDRRIPVMQAWADYVTGGQRKDAVKVSTLNHDYG